MARRFSAQKNTGKLKRFEIKCERKENLVKYYDELREFEFELRAVKQTRYYRFYMVKEEENRKILQVESDPFMTKSKKEDDPKV